MGEWGEYDFMDPLNSLKPQKSYWRAFLVKVTYIYLVACAHFFPGNQIPVTYQGGRIVWVIFRTSAIHNAKQLLFLVEAMLLGQSDGDTVNGVGRICLAQNVHL